ncbi:alpha/beta hydrolase-fold protein [Planctomicrobium sp. SH664]|uniref:alpha/beta hydrolase-fold protein n=1 Tax=Planctomicrobium sp. SH664 TaxID=3448125 RepID=UPI003F5C8B4C
MGANVRDHRDSSPGNNMWKTVTIGERTAEVFQPEGAPFRHALIYLHAFAGESLADHPAFTEQFQRFQLPVIAPRGGKSWWLDLPDASGEHTETVFQFCRDTLPRWIAQQWGVTSPGIGLLGVTVGGQGVLQLAYRHALRFPVVAAISPAIDFDQLYGQGFGVEELFATAEAARQETVILHLHPLNWPRYQFFCCDRFDPVWRDGCERLASKLASSGVPFTADLQTSHGGHGWPYFEAMAETAVSFLAEKLQSLSDERPGSRH